MKIYVDFDDVICKTAQGFCVLAKKMYGMEQRYEDMFDYNIQKSFHMEEKQYIEFMLKSQEKENLSSLQEAEGAVDTLNAWIDAGYDVEVVTGRPFYTYDTSREWLDKHNLSRIKLIHVDKYGRELLYDSVGNVSLEEFYKYHYDFAVEDSPIALRHLEKIENCKVAVISKPWNVETKLDGKRFVRCNDWTDVNAVRRKHYEENHSGC